MNPKLVIALFAFALPLAGCGNKGPLVLAQPPAPVEAPAAAPGEVPVEIAPEPVAADAVPETTPAPAGLDDVEPEPVEPDPATDDGNG